jgi:hypothetical protein
MLVKTYYGSSKTGDVRRARRLDGESDAALRQLIEIGAEGRVPECEVYGYRG